MHFHDCLVLNTEIIVIATKITNNNISLEQLAKLNIHELKNLKTYCHSKFTQPELEAETLRQK